jgi:hypothetical protein
MVNYDSAANSAAGAWVLTSLPITLGTTADTAAAGNDSRITGALQRSGGTMTGKITLDADPSSNLHAATKQYVDGQDFGIGQTWRDDLPEHYREADRSVRRRQRNERPVSSIEQRLVMASSRHHRWVGE